MTVTDPDRAAQQLTDASRRRCLAWAAAAAGSAFTPARAAPSASLITRAVPSGSDALPVVGLGSWISFNVGTDRTALASCTAIVRAFFEAGGRLIDSSPMYGSSQPTIGHALAQLGPQPGAG